MIRPTTAFVNSVGNLGGFFGPNMIGWLKDTTGSFTAGLYGLAGMLTLAALSAPLIKLVRRELPSAAPSMHALLRFLPNL